MGDWWDGAAVVMALAGGGGLITVVREPSRSSEILALSGVGVTASRMARCV